MQGPGFKPRPPQNTRNNKIIEISCLFEDIGKTYHPMENEITKLGTSINISKALKLKNQTLKQLDLMN